MPPRAINDDFQFSWSLFESYQQCPHKFYEKYILGHKEPVNIFALYGCAFHELLDHMYKKEKFIPNYLYSIWEKYLQKEYTKGKKQGKYNHILSKEVEGIKYLGFKQIKAFFETANLEGLLKPAVFTEQFVKGHYKKHKVVAKIDLGIYTKYGLTLIDWKTGKPSPQHFYQLALYAAIYQKVMGVKIDAVGIFYIKTKQVFYKELTPDLCRETSEYISKIYDAILTDKEFAPIKNEYCKYCHLKKLKCKLWAKKGKK